MTVTAIAARTTTTTATATTNLVSTRLRTSDQTARTDRVGDVDVDVVVVAIAAVLLPPLNPLATRSPY